MQPGHPGFLALVLQPSSHVETVCGTRANFKVEQLRMMGTSDVQTD